MNEVKPLWEPSQALKQQSFLHDFMRWLEVHKQLSFADYDQLWAWSIQDLEGFWGSFWTYAGILSHQPYEQVLQQQPGMIGTKWFSGATLNYAEHVFRHQNDQNAAICFLNEAGEKQAISWKNLAQQVASVAHWMKGQGVQKGDRVVSVLPNIPEAVIAFLATQSIGAIWSSCSPDFGQEAITDRFEQLDPKILFISDGYAYNGKRFVKQEAWQKLIEQLPSLKVVVELPILGSSPLGNTVSWSTISNQQDLPLTFEPLPFDHPLWILFSSGTTGKPKAIVHTVGGNLIEHLKVLMLHWDVKPGERFFWYSTTGWMMWNFALSSLLVGATLMLYDGSPAYPTIDRLWQWLEEEKINHFGGGAAYFQACMGAEAIPFRCYPHLRTIGSTGSPLSAACYEWLYQNIKQDLWLISFSGGTDICSGFVGGCPLLPVYPGEIQCRLLGVALQAFDDAGQPLINQMGEMVITAPMPSMPLCFWKDGSNKKYQDSYYSVYPNVWRHGDWIEVTDRGTIIIYGRSDATLNRDGVRIGTAEIYAVVEQLDEVKDSVVIGLEVDTTYRMILFVQLAEGFTLNDALKQKIKLALKTKYSPRHVPDEIYETDAVPYTSNGKKKEIEFKNRIKKELLS